LGATQYSVKAEASLPHSKNGTARHDRPALQVVAVGANWLALRELGEVDLEFVDEAPAPVFAGFEGAHDGVLGAVEVLGGVLVFGGVAAADVAAFHAQAEMHPGVAHFQALLAAFGVRRYLVNVA
jgi:hypothetical protein